MDVVENIKNKDVYFQEIEFGSMFITASGEKCIKTRNGYAEECEPYNALNLEDWGLFHMNPTSKVDFIEDAKIVYRR